MNMQIPQNIANILNRIKVNPFMEKCGNGTITKTEIKNWMFQDYIISQNFTKFMAQAASTVGDLDLRAVFIQNAYEELGQGCIQNAHFTLKKNLLLSVGETLDTISNIHVLPSTQFHLDQGFYYTSQNEYYAVGYIWANEMLVPYEYEMLKQGALIWFPDCDTRFFGENIESDEGHANIIYNFAQKMFDNQSFLEGIRAAVASRIVFYEGILEKELG